MYGAEVIPDEAVEAAAKRLAQFAGLDQWPLCAHQARAALEAAAPHLMAAAWDEGAEAYPLCDAAVSCGACQVCMDPYLDNPYRSESRAGE